MKKGISLVALVITIIVLIILTGTIILTATNTNIFGKSEEAVFKNNVASFKEELTKKIMEKKLEDPTFSETTINATTSADIAQWIPSIVGTGYEDKFQIVGGKLVFTGEDTKQIEYVEKLGITVSQANTSSGGSSPVNSEAYENLEKYILGPNKTGRSLEEIIDLDTGIFINEASTIPNASETVLVIYGNDESACVSYNNAYYIITFNESGVTTGLNVAVAKDWAANGLTSSNVVFNTPYNCTGEAWAFESFTMNSNGGIESDYFSNPSIAVDLMIEEGEMVVGEDYFYIGIVPDETGTVDYYMLIEFDGAGTAKFYYCEAADITGTPTKQAIKDNDITSSSGKSTSYVAGN